MPCSALIEPENSLTMSCTVSCISSHSARECGVAARRRVEIEMQIAVAQMAEA